MKGVGTVDGIFSLKQVTKNFREKQKTLLMVFIGLEKAYNKVPRPEEWRCLR